MRGQRLVMGYAGVAVVWARSVLGHLKAIA